MVLLIIMENQLLQTLKSVGLNQVEAEVYHLLLTEPPMTAYKVGKLLKKPTANIYKAIEALRSKGAVMTIEGKKQLCKAVDPAEFIALTQRQFTQKLEEAAQALTHIKRNEETDDGTYTLDSVELAMEKAKQMIANATVVLVVDAFPVALKGLVTDLEAACDRGVKVLVQSYDHVKIEGAEVFLTPNHQAVISYWRSQQLNLVADGEQSLVALFDQQMNTVYHATWSTNTYMSCILHSGRLCEQTIQQLIALPDSADKLAKMEKILESQPFFRNTEVPGVKKLFEQYLSE